MERLNTRRVFGEVKMQTFNTQQHIAEMAAQDEIVRMQRIGKASKAYYAGYTKPLKTEHGKPDDNAMPNFARVIVDKSASFLVGKGAKLDIEDGKDGEANSGRAWLDECLKYNRFSSLLMNAATTGGIAGHTFIKLNGAKPGQKYPRIILLDTNSVTVTTDPEDIFEVLRYRIQFNAIDPRTAKPIVRRQIIEKDEAGIWNIKDYDSSVGGGFVQIGETIRWPYAWAPILECQNLPAPNAFFGMSDLEPDILHLIERIHYILSNTGRINRFHAYPKTVGSGFQGDKISAAPDETIILPQGGTLNLLEAHGDIAGSLSLSDKLSDILFMLSRIPPVSIGKLDTIGAVAGVALQILYAPLMELTLTKRMLYEPMLESLGEHLLEMGGFVGRKVEVLWGDPMPQNDIEKRQIYSDDLAMGIVDKQTVATRLGYDWEQVRQRIAENSTSAADALLKAMENAPPSPDDPATN